ncbi:MAG: Flp pilus assembly protein CpaB [Candidatus Eremiobacteraeota bacterium]|nr:Flp pilus assembly protein CpaB [Candidatus Eremiobacteraeota bacterium]
MNPKRTTLLVAIILALGTGWLTLNYLSSVRQASSSLGQPRDILVALQDIPARATITTSMFRRQTRAASQVEPDAIAEPAKATGALSLITIPSGATLTASKIGRPTDVGLPVRLTRGMRAVSISIDKVKGVSGLLQPGDRVDVIAIPPRSGTEPPLAATILRGVRVLALGNSLENAAATPSPEEQNSTTVTLEVTPKQANLIAMADVNATLRLSLRSPREAIRSQPTELLVFPKADSAIAPAAAAVAPAAAPQLPPTQQAMPQLPTQESKPLALASPPTQRSRGTSSVTVIDGDRVGSSTDGPGAARP